MDNSRAVQATVAIRLLGRFEVVVDGKPVDDAAWRGRKAQQLVKLLGVAPGRSLHREQITEILWPDLDVDAADRQLHKAIHASRRAFEPELTAGAESAWLLTQDRTVSLSPGVVIDADEAEAAAEVALASRDLDACSAALGLFSGALLPADLYESWSDAKRTRLSALHSRLLAAVAEGAFSAEQPDRAADAANRLLAIDISDERAYRVLMQVAWLSGDRSAVIRHYRACESALETELGVEPSDSSRSLFEQLIERSNDPAAAGSLKSRNGGAVRRVAMGEADESVVSTSPASASTSSTDVPALAVSKRRSWGRGVGFAALTLLAVLAVSFLAFPRLRTLIRGETTPRAQVVTVAGTLPWPFVRVSLAGPASGWSAFTNAEGRFVLHDTSVRVTDVVTLVVEGDGAECRSTDLRIPDGGDSGTVDLGSVDVSAMKSMDVAKRRGMDRTVPFDRANLEWYRGVSAAVTAGASTDHDRVNALHQFVAHRYTRPADNGPVETPRRTIEVGTLFSGPLPVAMATLAHAAGYETRLVALSAPRPVDMEHIVVEVFYDGRWHLFDPAFGVAAVNDLGEIANLEDLVRHPVLIDRMPYASVARPGWRGDEVPTLLRSGVHRLMLFGGAATGTS